MLKYILSFLFLLPLFTKGQNIELANSFFNNGSYSKALLEFDKILIKKPYKTDCFLKKIKCHQELEQYNVAQQELNKKLINTKNKPSLYIELGYNYMLQKDSLNAVKTYKKAIAFANKNPNYAISIGNSFEKYNLLAEAEITYLTALEADKTLNFDYQLANIYGQQNETQKMFDRYLKLIINNKKNTAIIQNLIGRFITDNPENKNNILLKKTILKNMQSTPDIFWNKQLSWLFVQQKEFSKAFTQEKAIFKRDGEDLTRIFNLGSLTKRQKDLKTSKKIFNFITDQPLSVETKIEVAFLLLEIKENNGLNLDYDLIINEYNKALDSFGINNNTIKIQLAYANFLAFKKQDITRAINFLKINEKQSLSKFNKAQFQMTQADILVADGKFNKALLNYTKIQRNLKNNILSQEARFKVAKTSYYKGDFNWALQQLNVLKKSTSQLIANDALDLHLLISDHINEDSLNIALKKYAKADLLFFRKKNNEATLLLNDIINNHPVSKIIDDALYLQASIYKIENEYKNAKNNYERIINTLKESIFIDDALFHLAIIELINFNNPKKAMIHYESIIFNHADSIYFVEAKKQYRKLRENLTNDS